MLICYQHTKQIANSYGGIGRWRARTRARGREGRYKYPSQQKKNDKHACVCEIASVCDTACCSGCLDK